MNKYGIVMLDDKGAIKSVCTSARYKVFSNDIKEIGQYVQHEAAVAAIKKMRQDTYSDVEAQEQGTMAVVEVHVSLGDVTEVPQRAAKHGFIIERTDLSMPHLAPRYFGGKKKEVGTWHAAQYNYVHNIKVATVFDTVDQANEAIEDMRQAIVNAIASHSCADSILHNFHAIAKEV